MAENPDSNMPVEEPVDLSSCEREPIHTPGRIQPFAALIAVSSDWILTHASENTAKILGKNLSESLGLPLGDAIGFDAVHQLRTEIQLVHATEGVARVFGMKFGDRVLNVSIHPIHQGFIFEIETAGESVRRDDVATVQALMKRIRGGRDFEDFADRVVKSLKALAGHDRVMLYRFEEDFSGSVIAEAKAPHHEAFLGLRYPAGDIPAQARALYLRSPLRVMADIDAKTVGVDPLYDPQGRPLDMSLAVSRAMSPIHCEYLRNMGVRSSMSLSIIRGGKLWGLLACHHDSPKNIDFKMRTALELFGELVTYEMSQREDEAERSAVDRAQGVHDRLMAQLASNSDIMSLVDQFANEVSTVIDFDGIAIYSDGEFAARGSAPTRDEFPILAKFLNRTIPNRAYATDFIDGLFPSADIFENRFAGVLAIPISRTPRDYIVLFRKEVAQSVNWAGDPSKPVIVGKHGSRLTPRTSFALWKEMVRGKSRPWSRIELRTAESLRVTLLEVLLKVSDDAMALRKRTEERQELLVAELNHRVRNILNLIQSLTMQTAGHVADTHEFTDVLSRRIAALARAHDQITRTDWGPTSIRDLVRIEFRAYMTSEDRLTILGDDVALEPQALSTLALVVHELVTNAAKYGALTDRSGHVEVTFARDHVGAFEMTWREIGGPPVQAPRRRGFGTTVVERSIPFELGGTARVDYKSSGVVAHFMIPQPFIRDIDVSNVQNIETAQIIQMGSRKKAPLKGTVLLVEDNMIIAMDAADHLYEGGVERVITCSTVSDALHRLEKETITAAMLDVSLGTATSLPVAKVLEERGIPFIIASGYGGETEVTKSYPDVILVRKPYSPEQIIEALRSAMSQ